MKPGRNDPCPCGSGRKYKVCCMAQDRAAEWGALAGHIGPGGASGVSAAAGVRAGRDAGIAAARATPTWQADAVPLMVRIRREGDARTVAVLVTAGGYVVHQELLARLGGEAREVAEALEKAVIAAAEAAGVLPEHVEVRHGDVAIELESRLAPRGVRVRAVRSDALDGVREAALSLLNHMGGMAVWPPPCLTETWSAWRLPRDVVAELFRAAASFYRAAPWRHVENLQAPRATLPSGRSWTAGILGSGGSEFGLTLYERERDLFEALGNHDEPDDYPFEHLRGRVLSITFDHARDVPGVAREARLARWELESDRAVPHLMTINTPGGGIARADAEDLTLLLRALPAFVEQFRAALRAEVKTSDIADIEWTHAATGVAFRYSSWLEGDDLDDDGGFPPSDGSEDLLDDVVFGDDVDEDQLDEADSRNMLRRIARDVMDGLGEDADPDTLARALNERLAAEVDALNATSRDELGGLSPEQVQALLNADWEDAAGAVRLRTNLSVDDVAHSDILWNARILLGMAQERGGLPATEKGNLAVRVVEDCVARMRFEKAEDAEVTGPARAGGEQLDLSNEREAPGRRTIEADIRPLHELRVLLELAGLLRRRRRQFLITKRGDALLADARAGELYALLFRTCFRKFHLAYGFGGSEWSELQVGAPYSLYRFAEVGSEWLAPDDLADDLLLPYVDERAPQWSYGDAASLLLRLRLLDRLAAFGLAERREVPGDFHGIPDYEYRRSALYDRFLTFAV